MKELPTQDALQYKQVTEALLRIRQVTFFIELFGI